MRYHVAVIGSGQGGVPLALDFAKRGKRVVLFERNLVGGTCVNVGCTPSKAFLAAAHWAGRARRGAALGVHCEVRVDVPAVMARVRSIVAQWHDGVEQKLAEERGRAGARGGFLRRTARHPRQRRWRRCLRQL